MEERGIRTVEDVWAGGQSASLVQKSRVKVELLRRPPGNMTSRKTTQRPRGMQLARCSSEQSRETRSKVALYRGAGAIANRIPNWCYAWTRAQWKNAETFLSTTNDTPADRSERFDTNGRCVSAKQIQATWLKFWKRINMGNGMYGQHITTYPFCIHTVNFHIVRKKCKV